MQTILSIQKQLEQEVDKLITIAEVQYNALSSVAFTYAGKFTNVLSIKGRHDQLSYMACDNARKLNKIVGSKTAAVIVKFEKPQTTRVKVETATKKAFSQAQLKAAATKSSINNVSREFIK